MCDNRNRKGKLGRKTEQNQRLIKVFSPFFLRQTANNSVRKEEFGSPFNRREGGGEEGRWGGCYREGGRCTAWTARVQRRRTRQQRGAADVRWCGMDGGCSVDGGCAAGDGDGVGGGMDGKGRR